MQKLSGLLNLNKSAGITSRDVVDAALRMVRPAKAGHAGTLDPLATGVLVVCVGPATRLIRYVQEMPKHYTGTFLLGRSSPTEDIEGELTELLDPPVPSREHVEEAAAALTGEILQRPPAFSAKKVQGERAYALARRGKTVRLKPHQVTVYRLEITRYEYPELVLDIDCSSGTYVRSLGRDLAERLGTAAVMSTLVRTAIGPYRLADALQTDDLNRENVTERLLPPLSAVPGLPQVELDSDALRAIKLGKAIPRPLDLPEANQYACVDPHGRLAAILVPRGPGRLGPALNLDV
ncbi:MAG: tRNA pseudouridine(55) synthase TruB [Thermoguttaceae bacterium]|jgi:tRNA pseudouridine55 synthase|nr:tRNA pseudouridine(55) synthase TruB [Thermoguttaceae bacterium]